MTYVDMISSALESQSGKWMSRAMIKSFLTKNHGYLDTPTNKNFLKKALTKFEKKGDSFRKAKNTKDADKAKAKKATQKKKRKASETASKKSTPEKKRKASETAPKLAPEAASKELGSASKKMQRKQRAP